MSWQTPKTDWVETDYCTYADMNRIAGNINYLLDASTLKDDYTQDDKVTLAEWNGILTALDTLAEVSKYASEDIPNASTTALNFNVVESFTLGLKEWIDLINRQDAANVYLGDELYLGDNQYLR